MNYKGQGHNNNVVLVLVPSRELKYDLCQDVLNTKIFKDPVVYNLHLSTPKRRQAKILKTPKPMTQIPHLILPNNMHGLFLPAAVTKKLKNNKQHNIRWGEHDIATTNIDVIVTRN
jgi:hypothetical protein